MPDAAITEYRTITLKPFGSADRDFTFPVHIAPPIKTGRTKVFPGHAVLGPTDPNVDDTLTTLNYMDISGGIGIYTINPASDINSYWYGIAEAEGTDGWTMAREAHYDVPDVFVGNHVPLGRIGDGTYGLWGTQLHYWDPFTQHWTNSIGTVGTVTNTEGIVTFNDRMFLPLGTAGYAFLTELVAGSVSILTASGVATPAYNTNYAETVPAGDTTGKVLAPRSNPRVHAFAVWKDCLYALTIKTEGYVLVFSRSGAINTWLWEKTQDNAIPDWIRMDLSFEPHTLIAFPNSQNSLSLWCSGRRGLKVYGDGSPTYSWIDTNFSNVPPHPDMGRAMTIFRPGEAIWITGGGGDAIQYTVGGAVVPASGPGGQKEGLPGGKRGSIVSWATDLFHNYALIAGETEEGFSAPIVEDTQSSDAMYVPDRLAVTSVIANTGKGWHPKWESQGRGKVPTKIVVSDARKITNAIDYRVFWNWGEESWSMQCRLSTHSARQAIQTNTGERFRSTHSRANYQTSYLEWGEFNAGSIANYKLASHAALLMEHATNTEFVQYEYYTEHDHDEQGSNSPPWRVIGQARRDASIVIPGDPPGDPRNVFPFRIVNAAGDVFNLPLDPTFGPYFSEGEPFRWIRQRLFMVSSNATKPPIVKSLSLAYLPQPQDAATKAYTVPLPVDLCPLTYQTTEQITNKLEGLLSPAPGFEKFLLLHDGAQYFRAYISSISYSRVPTPDGPGALQLTVIQIPSGLPGLVGERR